MEKVYHKSYLTTIEIINIKKALKTMPTKKVSKLFNISHNTIRNIYNGISYRNIGE